MSMKELTFEERAKLCANPAGRRVFETMARKKSCLSFNPDVTTSALILETVRQVGAECCMIKTHMDIVEDFSPALVEELTKLSEELDFVIFEDRKFADIGNTAKLQYAHGHTKIASWSHVTNAHCVAGPGTVEALKEVGVPLERGLMLVAQMSTKGTLADGGPYSEACVKQAYDHDEFVFGFVAQHRLTDHPGFLTLTPGVKLAKGGDGMGQQYNTPESVMALGADIIQVGRGILNAEDRAAEAKKYREQSWAGYLSRLEKSPIEKVPYPKSHFA
eukprot:TRINITY_DN17817_c0_g1_i1.p1 TRINITY_DN17817_c0_g1~~TRINITY_DN17817_c0_g1_i1.p1  ORF type:complete len:275 (+),score=123.15 TRINITY_DN17817_c0_g1_i1:52-876(+)